MALATWMIRREENSEKKKDSRRCGGFEVKRRDDVPGTVFIPLPRGRISLVEIDLYLPLSTLLPSPNFPSRLLFLFPLP